MKKWFLVLAIVILMLNCNSGSSSGNGGNGPDPGPGQEQPQQQGTTYWWNDVVFYEIFVRSFYDSDGDGIGDLQGVIAKLDYLNDGNPNTDSDLGITGIWLMPVNPSPSYHGYDVEDYRTIEPDYGTDADFVQLINEAHNRGIMVIMDLVINHTSSAHPWFIASASNPQSQFRNWYRWSQGDPGQTGPWGQQVWHRHANGEYYYGVFWSGMPDLNYNEPAVRTEIKDIAGYWLATMNVDGFRCDAAKYILEDGNTLENTDATLQWWQEFYDYYKGIDAQAMVVGEAWDDTETVSRYVGGKMDFCFEFDLAVSLLNGVQNGSPQVITSKMEELMDSYPYHQYGTFLSNHDQDRVFNRLSNSPGQAKLAAAIYLTLPGIPFVYYGEEVGMVGQSPDEDRRRPMQWSDGVNAGFTTGIPWHTINVNYPQYNVETEQSDTDSIWNWYRQLIHWRNRYPELRRGTYHPLTADTGVISAYIRQFENDVIVVVANFSGSERTNMQLSAEVSNISPGTYTVDDVTIGNTAGSLTVGENGSIVNWVPLSRIAGRGVHLLKLN